MPHAARLAELFKSEFGLDTDFIKGQGGILEVKHQGNLVWTNRDNGGGKPTNEEARSFMHKFLKQL